MLRVLALLLLGLWLAVVLFFKAVGFVLHLVFLLLVVIVLLAIIRGRRKTS
jgi:hypothetical protein